MVFDKSTKHTTIYGSYSAELAAKYIKSVKLSNFTEIYSLTNEKKYDMDNLMQKHLLYKQFVTWACNVCSVAPLTHYINNPVYQELIESLIMVALKVMSYTTEAKKLDRNDSKINLAIQLKKAATHKLGLRIWANSLGEYL